MANVVESGAPGAAAPAGTESSGGLVDILAQLDSIKRSEMLALVSRYKTAAVSMPEFMMKAREILGDRLYTQLARDMNKAAQMQQAQMAHQMPSIRPPQPHPVFTHPQMFAPAPSMLSAQYYAAPTGAFPMQPQASVPSVVVPAAAAAAQSTEVDVTKMDTSSLQDVIQYSGVDLKAEAEALYREHDQPTVYNQNLVDHRLKIDYFFNPLKMRAILQGCIQRHYLSNRTANAAAGSASGGPPQDKPLGIGEEAVQLLGIAIQKRLISILRRLAELSRHRVDYGRGRFKIKIENDPKKQLWLLEKLFIEGLAKKDEGGSVSGAINTTINSVPSLQSFKASTTSAAAAAGGGKDQSKDGKEVKETSKASEDISIKTKLANVTAMAALGIRQKSWMSGAAASMEKASASSSAASDSGSMAASGSKDSAAAAAASSASSAADQAAEVVHPLAAFYSLPSSTPLSDAELKAQYYSRAISIVDLISYMENDVHLRRSKLLAVLYEALPRENKEYTQPKPEQH